MTFQPTNISAIEDVRRETVDVYNRLHSIDTDAHFIDDVHAAYAAFPLIPNLRCGAWYTNPDKSAAVFAYFKSTDGHHGQWAFNLRRANLGLLAAIAQSGGVLLVDSTRRGKRIPDALAKTVPLWCAVINAAVGRRFYGARWPIELFTPPGSVGPSEHSQMESLVSGYADDLLSSDYTLPVLSKPLRPFWITPATTSLPLAEQDPSSLGFFPVICVSASKMVPDGIDRRAAGYVYVQGSGDDHELWSQGLTPQLFWRHRTDLLAATRDELPDLAAKIVASEGNSQRTVDLTTVPQTDGLLGIAMTDKSVWTLEGSEAVILLQQQQKSDDDAAPAPAPIPGHNNTSLRLLVLHIIAGKRGQHHFMHTVLPQACAFAKEHFTRSARMPDDDVDRPRLVVAANCAGAGDNGEDAAVGVALAILQQNFDEYGSVRLAASPGRADKETIRKRLQWILESRPGANPSRTTLKRVNEFLLSDVIRGSTR
ncbi:initiator tRNA phosphoribosyl transferase [Auriculariales sp. MPI-PUGE-AT-0066]|nr:initiator tRNA phosphoribosyl transferase [Auriculariales sp. MPI-PUGE-AT-0066]